MMYSARFLLLTAFFFFSFLAAAAQETGGVKGKVRTSKSEALSGVSVTAQKDGKDLKTAITDKVGSFEMNNLEIGDYTLVFNKQGYNSGILYNVEIKKNKTRDLGNRLILAVDQGTQVIIKGVVFDENGRSVRGANVEIEKKQSDGSYEKIASTTSSYGIEPLATGEFVFRFPQGAADFRITATMNGVSASDVLNVSTAAVYRLALTLKREK